MINEFLQIFVKFFFILTPFMVLTFFLAMSRDYEPEARHKLAVRVAGSVIGVCFCLYFFGNLIFSLFGITLDAFRIGAGSLLFLTSVGLVRGEESAPTDQGDDDIAVVPLAIPITVGPGTIGVLLVMGVEVQDTMHKVVGCCALLAACVALGGILYMASAIERILGKRWIKILGKLTGLILAALSAQIIFTGVKNFLAA